MRFERSGCIGRERRREGRVAALALVAAITTFLVVLGQSEGRSENLPESAFIVGVELGVGTGRYENPDGWTEYGGGFLLPGIKLGYLIQPFEIDFRVVYNSFRFGMSADDDMALPSRERQRGQLRTDLLLRFNLFSGHAWQLSLGAGPVVGATFHYTDYDRYSDPGYVQSVDHDGPTKSALSVGWSAFAGLGHWIFESWRWSVGFQFVSGQTLFDRTKTFLGGYAVFGLDYAI